MTIHFLAKKAARDYALALRQTWSPETLARWSVKITDLVLHAPLFQATESLCIYVGARPGEIQTRDLIREALRQKKRVLVPITHAAGRMTWSKLDTLDDLAFTKLGLLEPPAEKRYVATSPTGLCIVPGLLFRDDGHRIGFGGGYFDRFLAQHTGPTVGLCPDACCGLVFPVEPHDIAVAWLATESGIRPMDDE